MSSKGARLGRAGRIAIGVVAACTLAADLYVLTQHDASTPVSLATALDDFRATADARTTADRTPPAPTSRSGEAASEQPRAERASASARPRSSRVATGRRGPPGAGVYTFRTDGWESISVAGARREYPSESHATVRLRDGCGWQIEYRLIDEHIDTVDYCTDARHTMTAHSSRMRWFNHTEQVDFTCAPPVVLTAKDDRRGARHEGDCRSDDTEVHYAVRYVESARVRVGRQRVPTRHVVIEATMRGRSDGSARVEAWYMADSGLLVRMIRDVDTQAKDFGGTRYREHLELDLTSITPRT